MKHKKPEKPKIKHSTMRAGGKTPAEELAVCDKCLESQWYVRGYPGDNKPRHCYRCNGRKREGTAKEREEALAALVLDTR